jgi:hypothetical protein
LIGSAWLFIGAFLGAVLVQGNPPQQVDGRVEKPAGTSMVPVAHVRVTLHRVGPDTANPIDSTRTDAAGRFRFTYHRFGSPEAIYFVSSTYDGIAYFSEPLKAAVVHGGDADITVFDTTSSPVPMSVRGRHLIVSGPSADGTRDVVEVFELSNDSGVTYVSPGAGDRPTWSAPLPLGAQQFAGGQGDVSPDAMSARDGRALVNAPFAPGVKQLSYRYSIPATAFPLRIRLDRTTQVFEVLLAEPMARLTGAGLKETNPVSLEGRTFRRFLAQDLPQGEVISVGVPGIPAGRESLFFAVLVLGIGGAMLMALARAFSNNASILPSPSAGLPVGAVGPGEKLAQEIVELDDTYAGRLDSLTPEERARYARRRSSLKEELTAVLTAGASH